MYWLGSTGNPFRAHFIVQMRPGAATRIPDQRNDFTAFDAIALLFDKLFDMTVTRRDSVSVINRQEVTNQPFRGGMGDHPIGRSDNRSSLARCDVQALV